MAYRYRSTLRALLTFLPLLLVVPGSQGKPFKYLSYAQIQYRLTELAAAHPNLLRLYSAQQTFLLPHVGNCTELNSANDTTGISAPCTVWVVELSNLKTLASDPARAEMLVSGLLHGDEVVGPQAVLAFIEYMVSHYATDPFVRRMVDTRLVTLIPMTNAIGFFKGERVERQVDGENTLLIDPNRDFAFDQKPAKCMQTVAARAINELFRTHLFRLLITFHGGTNVVGYEWGDTQHCKGRICAPAPDTAIMDALGKRMSHNAGPAGAYEAAYPVGDMGKLVYPVNGGLEDWAYGASWSGQAVVCKPPTLGGYPQERTKLETVQKRCVTYLVETAKSKKPKEETLGASEDIMERGAAGDGHVPRNVRLLISAVDSIEPYIVVDSAVTTDGEKKPVISWQVGGSFLVDGSALQWSTVSGNHSSLSGIVNGTAGLVLAGGSGKSFSGSMPGSYPTHSLPAYVRVVAVVDNPFAVQPNGSSPDVSPQSHLMGSRASSKWSFSSHHHKIEGQQVFFSETKRITRSEAGVFEMTDVLGVDWAPRSMSDADLFLFLTKKSSGPASGNAGNIIEPKRDSQRLSMPLAVLTGIAGVLVVLSIAVTIYVFARRKRNSRSRSGTGRSAFSIGEDEADEEERKALTPADEEMGQADEETEAVLAASGLRMQHPLNH